MVDQAGYELIDAGDGRRLERFGRFLVDRPAPAAVGRRLAPSTWRDADLRFDRSTGWTAPAPRELPDRWETDLHGLRLELRPTDAGQVGVFPEQQPVWSWLGRAIRRADAARGPDPRRVLNLFAYTGVATLVASAAGASVTHVDASRPAVAWARDNARLSGLDGRPIRWLVDDAAAFVRRELRRSVEYDGVVLDPPTYGHGGRGAWRLDTDLRPLLSDIGRLLGGPHPFVVLTAHTPGLDAGRLAELVTEAVRRMGPGKAVDGGPLDLIATSGASLPLGAFARWQG